MTDGGKTPESSPYRLQTSWGSEFAGFEGNPDFVLSLARGLRVIECFEGHAEGLSIAEIRRLTGLSRAAVRRLLITLELLGYVEVGERGYRLQHRILRLGLSYLSSTSFVALAQATSQRMTEELDEACGVSILDSDEALFVAGSVPKRIVSPGSSMGIRLPAYCSSMGRVLLAALPEDRFLEYVERVERKRFTRKTIVARQTFVEAIKQVRSEGYALVDEELELDLRAISVPIFAGTGRVAAALGLATQASRFSVRELRGRFLPILKEQAKVMGRFAG